MDPEKMIGSLDALADRVAILANNVRTQTRIVSGQWERLGKVGGQRADHAAKMMTELIGPLREMQDFADIAIMQIKEVSSNPFASDESSTWGA